MSPSLNTLRVLGRRNLLRAGLSGSALGLAGIAASSTSLLAAPRDDASGSGALLSPDRYYLTA